jgi:hypothetical protein
MAPNQLVRSRVKHLELSDGRYIESYYHDYPYHTVGVIKVHNSQLQYLLDIIKSFPNEQTPSF